MIHLAKAPGMESFFIVIGVLVLIFGIAYFISSRNKED
ncbi:MAG: hypothetical protein RL432_909 [Bacteroidota bacterium]|jgi:preprotein translocase subunit YajC